MLGSYIKSHLDMGCAGALAMPNTKPPTAVVFESDESGNAWSIERYMRDLQSAGGSAFEQLIVPLYLTKETTPEMIIAGAKSGILKACKYYPPHGTTGAEFGAPLSEYVSSGVLAAMEEVGVVLCVHGEEHNLAGDRYFDLDVNAETIFYSERLPQVVKKFPKLKIVCEHITTKAAVDFVRSNDDYIAATITPQHLLYTIGDLIKGLKYHLFCLPVLKYCKDREALLSAVIDPSNTQFFAGTDSAPHIAANKATECGCAAGCFTGGVAPQLYVQAFEIAGMDMSQSGSQDIFKRFLCSNGADFYGLPVSGESFSLIREDSKVEILKTSDGDVMPLPVGLGCNILPWNIKV